MGPFDCGFSIVLQTGLISKSFKSGTKPLLNYELLYKTTLRGLKYWYIHVLLNNWLILEDVLLMYFVLPSWNYFEL